jgi:hypothetical protein
MNLFYTQIEDYLDQHLNAAEMTAFQEAMRADPGLAESVELLRQTRSQLQQQWRDASAENALKTTLQEIGQSHFKSSPPNGTNGVFKIIAFLVLLAMLTAYLVYRFWGASTGKEPTLYAQYKRFPVADFVQRSGAQDSLLAEAGRLFNQGLYQEALQQMANLPPSAENAELRFFKALAYLETGNVLASRDILQALNTPNGAWQEEAAWYLALSYLKEGKTALCREFLEKIPATNRHYEAAQQLIKKI